jgi:outer membrane protein OmpA-like peptidoglycan-associated protein
VRTHARRTEPTGRSKSDGSIPSGRTHSGQSRALNSMQAGTDRSKAGSGHSFSRIPLYAKASGTPRPLPHKDAIERSFGPGHDLSTVRARVGGPAVVSNALLGSSAFTRGEQVEFSAEPSLEEAAHEAAHVVQQRQGFRPPGGLSRAGDGWERNADAVAARVTRGEPASDLLGAPAPPLASAADAPVQRRLIAHGSDVDIARFFALAEPACGELLHRDPATDEVAAVASSNVPATSPAFAAILDTIMNAQGQDAEVQFGEHQAAPNPAGRSIGVFMGAFPFGAQMIQVLDLDDLEAVEAAVPGRGVVALAHELQENFVAHTLPPGAGSFPAAHAAGVAAGQSVVADLIGPESELLTYTAMTPTGQSIIKDYGTYFYVLDRELAPQAPGAPPDIIVAGARQVPPTIVATYTDDNFASDSDVVPATAAPHVAAALASLAADPTAAVHVEGYTDDLGTPADNLDLGRRRAENGRNLFGAGNDRVAAIARGAINFVVPNTSEANRAQNRRIVITVVRP